MWPQDTPTDLPGESHIERIRVHGRVWLFIAIDTAFSHVHGYFIVLVYLSKREPALSLGVAFQLTNILRDVGEDAVKRGRVYLPREDMERFHVSEEQIFARRVDENYIRLMKFEIERARMYYDRARRGYSCWHQKAVSRFKVRWMRMVESWIR